MYLHKYISYILHMYTYCIYISRRIGNRLRRKGICVYIYIYIRILFVPYQLLRRLLSGEVLFVRRCHDLFKDFVLVTRPPCSLLQISDLCPSSRDQSGQIWISSPYFKNKKKRKQLEWCQWLCHLMLLWFHSSFVGFWEFLKFRLWHVIIDMNGTVRPWII